MSESDAQSVELAKVNAALAAIAKNESISIADVVAILAPPAPLVKIAEKLPIPTQITPAQKKALAALPKVYGKVVPDTRRELVEAEVTALLDERESFDEVDKLIKSRKENIRTAVFNHFDVEFETSGSAPEDAPRSADGHYIVAGSVRSTERNKGFARQVSNKAPTLDAYALKQLVDDADVEFTHQDYLSMTTQTRVFDEDKVMAALKKNPKLIHAIKQATTPGGQTASLVIKK